ncbi:MAG: site-specific DNA-methyltransferase, partial [Thermoproteota archaeon]|nr:site-specific DNA-methyltransferase [Thermoproteota archaeon]
LTDDQRAILASRMTEKLRQERQQQAGKLAAATRWSGACDEIAPISSHPKRRTRHLLATTFGVSERRMRSARFIHDHAPDLADEVLRGSLLLIQALSLAKRRANLAALAHLPDLSPTDRLHVLCGDFREVGAGLPDASIDLIVTDPPYTKAAMPLWDDVAAFANRVLKPSGFFITYSGTLYVPEAIQRLGKHLTYYWLACLEHRGAHRQNYFRHVFELMKPILIYAKEPVRVQPEWLMDIVKSTGPDKRYHDWGQSVEAVRYLVTRFSKPGDLVLDPCSGSGTNVLAALLEGRRAIAIELNPLHATTIRKRGQEILAAETPHAS